jgi:hypothetical protein
MYRSRMRSRRFDPVLSAGSVSPLTWLAGIVLASAAGCVHAPAPVVVAPVPVTEPTDPPEEPEDLSLVPSAPFDAKAFTRTYAETRVSIFTPSSMPAAALTRSLRATRSASDRRTLRRALVIVHLLAAEQAATPEARETERRAMVREARLGLSGNRDAHLAAELAFTEVWLAWVSDAEDAQAKAEAFLQRHVADRELSRIVTMIRAELAFARGALAVSRSAFAILLGDVRDPLHAYASYRTAASFCANAEHPDECRQWRQQTRLLGCAPTPTPETVQFAERAFLELGSPTVPRRERERGAPRYCSRAATASYRDPLSPP